MIIRKYPCVLFIFILAFSFTFFIHSLVSSRFFIFMREEIHCVCFDRDESLTEIHQQVVVVMIVSAVVNNGVRCL